MHVSKQSNNNIYVEKNKYVEKKPGKKIKYTIYFICCYYLIILKYAHDMYNKKIINDNFSSIWFISSLSKKVEKKKHFYSTNNTT